MDCLASVTAQRKRVSHQQWGTEVVLTSLNTGRDIEERKEEKVEPEYEHEYQYECEYEEDY
jgi:hypothetical protein